MPAAGEACGKGSIYIPDPHAYLQRVISLSYNLSPIHAYVLCFCAFSLPVSLLKLTDKWCAKRPTKL
jgi:hypothetical protein